MASSLKSHVDGVKQQYQECNEALENFTKEKIEFTNNLLEKVNVLGFLKECVAAAGFLTLFRVALLKLAEQFRLLLNSKKEKIVKLIATRNKQQERIENLEKGNDQSYRFFGYICVLSVE